MSLSGISASPSALAYASAQARPGARGSSAMAGQAGKGGALTPEQQAQVAKLKARKPVTVTNTVEKVVEKVVNTGTYVFFAKNSSELTETAKAALDKVSGKVNVTASASPEGTDAYNKALSEKRADAVAAYLKANGVTVCSVKGIGNTGSDSGRVAVVSAE